MSKNRMVNTKFWSDSFIVEKLNSLDRYLFLYLLTNEKTNNIGIYEISMRTIAFETGIEKETLGIMIKRLEEKILYIDGWVCFKNFVRHQSPNPNMKKGMYNNWDNDIPASLKEKLKPFAKDFKGFIKDSLFNLTKLNLTKPNLTKLNFKDIEISKEISNTKNKKSFQDLIKENFNDDFIENICEKYNLDRKELKIEGEKFMFYRTEKNMNGNKEKWEMEKTFDIKRRFITRLGNRELYSSTKKTSGIGIVE